MNICEKTHSKDEEIAGLRDVMAEITQENLALKKVVQPWNSA